MKAEKRGKYSGVKLHLDGPECEFYLKLSKNPTPKLFAEAGNIAVKIGAKIAKLQAEYPSLLKERTKVEIQHELEVELESADKKIKALKSGGNWQDIHIK